MLGRLHSGLIFTAMVGGNTHIIPILALRKLRSRGRRWAPVFTTWQSWAGSPGGSRPRVCALNHAESCFVGSAQPREASRDEEAPLKEQVCGPSLGRAGRGARGSQRPTLRQPPPQSRSCRQLLPRKTSPPPGLFNPQRQNPLRQKLPLGTEAGAVLAGELGFLAHPLGVFVRLRDPVVLGPLTEVPLPSR